MGMAYMIEMSSSFSRKKKVRSQKLFMDILTNTLMKN